MFFKLLLLGILAYGGWWGWQRYHHKKVPIPKWLAFWQNGTAPTDRIEKPVPTPVAPHRTNEPKAAPKTNTPVLVTEPATPTDPVTSTNSTAKPEMAEHESRQFRNVANALEAQIALARKGISVGPIDGSGGGNMRKALLAWQVHNNLAVSGELDDESKAALLVEEPLFIQYTVSEADLRRIMKVPSTWVGKSQAERLDYESILELIAEKGRSSADFIKKLNPQIDWDNVRTGALVKIPRIDPPPVMERGSFVRVHLYTKTLDVFGKATNLIAHFPCSIASRVEKRPVGVLHVVKAASNPTYLFDPEVFPESEEAKKITRKLTIPAGPNNPVGTAWIGLDRPGYGIHGTPKPEQVGRTESHGCFRLANWNAEHLLQLVWAGMPVIVEN